MKSIVVILLSLVFLSWASLGNSDDYQFAVKIINKTGKDLTKVSAVWNAKGEPRNNRGCFSSRSLSAGESYQRNCFRKALAEKWQRQIEVTFTCPSMGARTITLPRNAKFYKRDHATSKGDRYTVRLKASDC